MNRQHVEPWGLPTGKIPTMRVECRIVLLNINGTVLREFERFYCDYASPRIAVEAYQAVRRFFVRERKKGRTEDYENGEVPSSFETDVADADPST